MVETTNGVYVSIPIIHFISLVTCPDPIVENEVVLDIAESVLSDCGREILKREILKYYGFTSTKDLKDLHEREYLIFTRIYGEMLWR